MGKDSSNSIFDFDTDSEFNENFYKNIEKVLSESDIEENEDAKENSNADLNTANSNAEDVDKTVSETASAVETISYDFTTEDLEKMKPTDDKELSEDEIDEELTGIKASLAKQICDELEIIGEEKSKTQQTKHRFMKIQNGIMLTLLCLIGFGFFFGFTKPGNQMLMGMGINIGGKIWEVWTNDFDKTSNDIPDKDYIEEDDLSSNSPELDPSQIVWPEHPGKGRHEEGVYNILLMGEEAIGSGGGRGRTDVIIIATLNTKNKTVKLTSLMRDMLVQIPGYKDNKLNTAYEKGGLDLMYETIALNFRVQLDGAVLVNFEKFEKIIDELGGLEITLTSGEAKYLNSTNYISKPQYRNVKAGAQILNGNQVLGYSRVRKRATITGNNNDYGRTDRHRIILNAIFDKYKTKSKVDLASIMFKLLPMITTDINSKNFELLLNSFIEMGTMEMSQLRIPADGAFDDNVKVRGMSVLIPDIDKNINILHDFIFGADTVTVQKTDEKEAVTTN